MKRVFVLIFYIGIGFLVQCQSSDKKDYFPYVIDVVLHNAQVHDTYPDLYINGKLMPFSLLRTISAFSIEKFSILRDSTRNKEGELHITLKNSYPLQIISINELRKRHTPCTDSIPCLFFIDNELVETDSYDSFILDVNQIKQILVRRFDNQNANIHLNLIKIELHAKKSQQMMAR
jgi:hypothetical protein